MTTRETIKALCICGTLSNISSSLALLHYECSIIWCYHYCSAYCLVGKEIKERDEDYKMPQISISITNPLNLCFSHGIKRIHPHHYWYYLLRLKNNWFLVWENECGMFCVRKITRWKAVGITKRLIHKC